MISSSGTDQALLILKSGFIKSSSSALERGPNFGHDQTRHTSLARIQENKVCTLFVRSDDTPPLSTRTLVLYTSHHLSYF